MKISSNIQAQSLPTEMRFSVEGMDCASCTTKIEKVVRKIKAVTEVSVSSSGTMVVKSHDTPKLQEKIEQKVRSLGYRANYIGSSSKTQSQNSEQSPKTESAWSHPKLPFLLFYGLILAAAYLISVFRENWSGISFTAAVIIGVIPIARRAITAGLSGEPFSIETLMSVAAIGAMAIGATEEAAIVIGLFLLGEVLEGVAAGRARASIRSLTKLIPKTARIEQDGIITEVPAESLSIGDAILVRPGDRIPADGTIISGEAMIDESPVSGESVPKHRKPNDTVFAGTIALDQAIRVRVDKAAADNTIARVVRLVEEAQEAKAPTARFMDRFSRWYTPGIMVAAALVIVIPPLAFSASWSEWIYKGLAILLIGCPCALVISTPAAIAAGLSAGARQGLLMKGGAVLETMGRVTTAAFDKTGTLTEGRPQVTDIVSFEGDERRVLSVAASLELGSSHPLAKAILTAAEKEGVTPKAADSVKAISGKGILGTIEGETFSLLSVRAVAEKTTLSNSINTRVKDLQNQGKTLSVVLHKNTIIGLIAMRDEPRADAKSGLAALSKQGISTIMLTGDNTQTAHAIAQGFGIKPHAELLPEDKLRIVEDLKGKDAVVAKIGDGINDAPALAAADVGIAMGGGTDVALETADAASLHGRISDIAAMVALSRRTMTNIRQNIVISLGLKAVFLATTILGVTGLWPAILADTGATVLVTLNALRLLNYRSTKDVNG